MSVERKPTLIVVSGPRKLPTSEKFQVAGHQVNFDNSFTEEVARLRSTVENFLLRGSRISLAGIGACGLVSIAAFEQIDIWYPTRDNKNLNKVVTFGTRFHSNSVEPFLGGKFENQGIAWLNVNQIAPELREKVTTVFWEGNIFISEREAKLPGATLEVIKKEESIGMTAGPASILQQSIDRFFML